MPHELLLHLKLYLYVDSDPGHGFNSVLYAVHYAVDRQYLYRHIYSYIAKYSYSERLAEVQYYYKMILY